MKLAKEISQQIERQAYSGIKTEEIFQKVKQLLNAYQPGFGIRFNLKQAMKALGPTGFHFEKYVGAILLEMGYKVKLNQFVSGKCLKNYEIDFVAEKGKVVRIGECKYHSQKGMAVDQEVALANCARFLDIHNGAFVAKKSGQGFEVKNILITNTRFSERAIKYSNCVGVELWGWKYPINNGLEVFIDKERLYPITILPAFKNQWAEIFCQNNLLLAKDVLNLDMNRFSSENHLPLPELERLASEAKTLL